MQVLCYAKCTTCQKAIKWLKEQDIEFEERPIKEQHPTREELQEWYQKSGLPLKKFFNTSGNLYKELQLKDKLPGMSEEEQLELLATDGMLVKRPLVVGADFVLTGFKEAEWAEKLQTVEEWLDIVDEQGNPTGEFVERKRAHREGIRHRSSHVWLFRIRDSRVQILLQKRSPGKDSFPGCYDISSAGHIPAGVDFVPSALRELQEELGVICKADQLDYCGQRSFYYEMEFYGELFRDRQVSNVYALWLDREESEFTLQQEEVESVKWFDFAECCERIRKNQIPHCIYVEEMDMLATYLQRNSKAQEPEDITLATLENLDRILEIYDIAKQYMRDSGNPNQWNGAYPDRETLEKDIAKQQLYVYKRSGVIHAVFVLLLGEEPTYAYIEGDGWLNEEPYGTIHRIAGDGKIKGIFEKCLEFCKTKVQNVRIDTHHDNHTMQHLAEKYGFVKCGIIYLKNGSPRIAYQYVE